ncbi:MAG: NUDIX hydrolase [Phycisphaerales bacterium]
MNLPQLPYKIAVLVYVYDADGNVLLLHRAKMPNKGMYSPIGGKLDVATGEGPHQCALREIEEEIGITLKPDDVHLCGMVSEQAYEHETHWLMFLFEVKHPIAHDALKWMSFDEGTLQWIAIDAVATLAIPQTDRDVMWPLIQQHRNGGFFVAHIDCRSSDDAEAPLPWTLHESRPVIRASHM